MRQLSKVLILLGVLTAPALADDEAAPAAKKPPAVRKVKIAAAGVMLLKPKGFELAERFHGFRDISRRSSVMVSSLPGPFGEVSKGLTAPGFRTRGMKLLSTKKLKIGENSAVLFGVSQMVMTPEKTVFLKWMLVFGDEKRTTMVTAAFPAVLADELSDDLMACVLSTESIAISKSDPGFTIAPEGKMKRNSAVGTMGKMIAFGLRDKGTSKPGEPLFVATQSFHKKPALNRHQFALNRLHQIPRLYKIEKVQWTRPIEVDGLPGFESLADATRIDPNMGIAIYQVMLFTDTGYFLMGALVNREHSKEFLPVFQKMAQSFKRTKK